MPDYIHENAPAVYGSLFGDKPANPTSYIQSRWCLMEMEAGLAPWPQSLDDIVRTPFRRVSDLEAEVKHIAGKPGLLIQMPQHEVPPQGYELQPLAFFVALVFGEDHRATIFTLERMIDPPEPGEEDRDYAILCGWLSAQAHCNYGMLVEPEKQAFVDAVTNVLSHSEQKGAPP